MVSDFSVASTQKGVFTLKAASTCGASTASAPSPFLIDSGTRLGSLKLQETGGLGDLWSVAQKTHERTLARPEGTSAQSVWNDRWNVRKISAPSTQPREISLTKTDVTQSSCPSDPPSLSLSPASQAQTEMERWFKTDNDSRSSNKPTDVQSTCRSDLPPFSEAEIQQIQMASWFKSYNDRPDKSDACTASSPIAGPDITDIESGKKSVRFQGPETSEFDEKGWTSSNDVTNPGSTGSGDSSSSYYDTEPPPSGTASKSGITSRSSSSTDSGSGYYTPPMEATETFGNTNANTTTDGSGSAGSTEGSWWASWV